MVEWCELILYTCQFLIVMLTVSTVLDVVHIVTGFFTQQTRGLRTRHVEVLLAPWFIALHTRAQLWKEKNDNNNDNKYNYIFLGEQISWIVILYLRILYNHVEIHSLFFLLGFPLDSFWPNRHQWGSVSQGHSAIAVNPHSLLRIPSPVGSQWHSLTLACPESVHSEQVLW